MQCETDLSAKTVERLQKENLNVKSLWAFVYNVRVKWLIFMWVQCLEPSIARFRGLVIDGRASKIIHRRKLHGGLRMDIVCYERIATLIQMKEINESRLRSCPGSETHSYHQWQAMGACLDALSPLEHGAFHKYTHTRRNTAAWFIKGQMWLFSPLPLKARFLCGCQRKLRKDRKQTLHKAHSRAHIRVGQNLEFKNMLSIYECKFQMNWQHPIWCVTERGIYWIQIWFNSTTDNSGVMFSCLLGKWWY